MFRLFGKPRAHNIAVIDICEPSVGAGYATISGVAPPALVHKVRIQNAHDALTGTLRALDEVARDMTGKGAPLLRKVTGSGSVQAVHILVSAPWLTSKLEVQVIEKEKPFIFTKEMLDAALKAGGDATLIASVLNGYETPNPVGKKVTRAEILLLSSTIDPEMEKQARRAVKTFVGAAPLHFISFPIAALQVLRGLFPHERDFLAIRIGSDVTELAFVKQGHLAGIEVAKAGTAHFAKAAREHGVSGGVTDTETGLIDKKGSERLAARLLEAEKAWVSVMRDALMKIASEGALPRVLFLFADDRSLSFFKRLIDSPELHDLWLSDEPLSVLPVSPRHFHSFMRHLPGEDADDAVLDMIALLSRVPS